MPANFSVNFTAEMIAAEACEQGDLLVYDSAAGYWKVATTANRTAADAGAQAIAMTDYGGSVVGKVSYKDAGVIPASITGLASGYGSRSFVRTSSTGRLERVAGASASDDIVGIAEKDGRVHLICGLTVTGLSSVTLPFNVASPSPASFGPGQEWISYGQVGDALPDVSQTVGSLIRMGDSIGASGDYYGVITWETPGGNSESVLSVAYNTGSLLRIGAQSAGTPTGESTAIFGGSILLKASTDQLYLASDFSDWDGVLASRRIAVGTSGFSDNASFGGTAAGPMIKLHALDTAPTGNPVGNPENPAVWIYFTEGGSDFLDVHFPSGNKARIPDVNATLLTGSSPVLTTPQINDTSSDHQYIFGVSELAADRTVTLPLLTGNDTFVFADFIQTLTNKTLTSPTLGGTPTLSGASTSTSNNAKGTAVDANPVNVQTTDATETTLETIAHATSDSMLAVSWLVSVIKDDGSQGAAYSVSCAIKNNSGTLSHCTGSPQTTVLGEDDSAWAATADFSGTNVRLRVTGNASDTLQWSAIRTSLHVIP